MLWILGIIVSLVGVQSFVVQAGDMNFREVACGVMSEPGANGRSPVTVVLTRQLAKQSGQSHSYKVVIRNLEPDQEDNYEIVATYDVVILESRREQNGLYVEFGSLDEVEPFHLSLRPGPYLPLADVYIDGEVTFKVLECSVRN